MESLLVWWNLTWTPLHNPLYSLRMDSALRCYNAIADIRAIEPHREMIGVYNRKTHICTLAIYKEEP